MLTWLAVRTLRRTAWHLLCAIGRCWLGVAVSGFVSAF